MKKILTALLALSLIFFGSQSCNADENNTLSFKNIVENSHMIPKIAWENANKKFKNSVDDIAVKVYSGPNSVSLNKNASEIIKKVSQLYSSTDLPDNVTVLNFGYSDRSWVVEEGSKIIGNNGILEKSWVDNWACPSISRCWGANAYFGKTLNKHLIVIATGVSHRSHFNGNIEAHEFTHNIQKNVMGSESPWPLSHPWPPMWYSEGQANFSSMMIAGTTYNEYLKEREYIFNSLLKDKSITANYIKNFLSNNYNSNINDKNFWQQYEIGSAFVEVLNAISGPDSTMDVYEFSSSGFTFEKAFSKVYNIDFNNAVNIISEAIYNNINEKSKPVLKNTLTKTPTLVVMDTALDTSIPLIKSKLVHEVCILDWSSCPNGKKFMEGPGSSTLPASIVSNKEFSHGTQMVSAAIYNNPNMNILFIRIIGNTSSGKRQSTNVLTVSNALEWVFNNKDKYNIVAVSASQGNQSVLRKSFTNYCPFTATDMVVDKLYSVDIPVFFPSGNDRDRSRINWPACIPNSVAVGGVEVFGLSKPQASTVSNYDGNLIDMWTEISSKVLLPGGLSGNAYGTSISTQIAAARYISMKSNNPTLTLADLLTLIKSKSVFITNTLNQNIFMFSKGEITNG